ncbi:hypothetical protein ES703_104213 [subsurface metagenome]
MSKEKLEKILYVRISNGMRKELVRLAEEDGRSIGSFVRQALKQYFKQLAEIAKVHTKKG